jgi:hypothetical protein
MKIRITVLIALCALVFMSTFANFSVRPPGVRMPQAWATSTPHPYINAASTTLSPVPVGTSTPVVVLYGRARCSWTMTWTGAGNLWCAPIPATVAPVANWTSTTGGSTTPDFTPAANVGFPFLSAQAPWSSGGSIVSDPSVGWECVSDSGTLNVGTVEFQHCYGQKLGQP